MLDLDPILIDRQLERAARTAISWQRRLKAQPDLDDHPLGPMRRLLGQPGFVTVCELDSQDPLRRPLQRWIFSLAEQRINHYWLTHWNSQRYAVYFDVEGPIREKLTLAELWQHSLGQPERRREWLGALFEHSSPSTETFVQLCERRVEIAKRLELASPDEMELPLEREQLEPVVDRWLERTDSLAAEFSREDLSDWVGLALGSEATAGFPAALRERALVDWFRETRLLEGLQLNTPRLPQDVAASSYLRALELLGYGLRGAGAPADLPYAVAHDVHGLEAHGLGWFFAQLLCSEPFVRKNLGLDRDNAREHQRVIARVLLLESRVRALKVKLRWAAQQGAGELAGSYETLSHQVLGCAIPEASAGVVLRQRPDDPQRFCAFLLGGHRFSEFVEAHDDDWYRNPRATDQLRSELKLPPNQKTSEQSLQAGFEVVLKELERLLQ